MWHWLFYTLAGAAHNHGGGRYSVVCAVLEPGPGWIRSP